MSSLVRLLPLDVPRKGNVDRNSLTFQLIFMPCPTFPARGTWIEIEPCRIAYSRRADVPRKGNVDRNFNFAFSGLKGETTFPARGTWIEIVGGAKTDAGTDDVPRKGNVDRNSSWPRACWSGCC